jgi:hypothetical protein
VNRRPHGCGAGRLRAGGAKVAILSSAFYGSISGVAAANTATTGMVTIPTMKKLGYPRSLAASVEAVASTGGQILPPVMGAGVFVMAELVRVPYKEIMVAATLPALLFFIAAWFGVHIYAMRYGLAPLPREAMPGWAAVAQGVGDVEGAVQGHEPQADGGGAVPPAHGNAQRRRTDRVKVGGRGGRSMNLDSARAGETYSGSYNPRVRAGEHLPAVAPRFFDFVRKADAKFVRVFDPQAAALYRAWHRFGSPARTRSGGRAGFRRAAAAARRPGVAPFVEEVRFFSVTLPRTVEGKHEQV